ncbi:phage collar protein [Salmonella enterica]|uniref:Uncharacterized protein n=2 Tax=Salmonella enterica TaxID=28901 RepID=A0A379QME8_SALER|nr:hypothetical protein [Salmonella enterica]ECC1479289.1 hypothetical protein [Salmonella enterica subsp. salamae]ASG88408.1 hypothetical protein LFZ47_12915 [Salmonella enterica subsp. salamae serovar 55:k:z39 str. 1315K]ECC1656474.1 hypothetical protein [Salmonella enterica subsp. salamae]ECD9413302.1 hypothetical protein [Salmonella enterica subsp. salamae]ECF5932487.1 hypothetical protein [Salmonella enterica subsp. salamae]
MIPGSNLLNLALSVIGSQALEYHAFTGRQTNAAGYDVAEYAEPMPVVGSFQPVPRTQYANLGLDYQKTYWNFYVSADVIDVARDVSGDQFAFDGLRYQCESITPWRSIDGWNAVLCAEIGSA